MRVPRKAWAEARAGEKARTRAARKKIASSRNGNKGVWRSPRPPSCSRGIIELAKNPEKIPGLQAFAGKILGTKNLRGALIAFDMNFPLALSGCAFAWLKSRLFEHTGA